MERVPGGAPGVDGIGWAGGETDEGGDACELDRLRISVSGQGLENAAAGMVSQFVITPRASSGTIINPGECPEPLPLVVVIVPAPLEHQMSRSEDGLYTCRWTAEYASDVKVDIKVGLDGASAQHVPGSPFAVTVHPAYRVYAEGVLAPAPWEYGM